jgi:hypothetical protein
MTKMSADRAVTYAASLVALALAASCGTQGDRAGSTTQGGAGGHGGAASSTTATTTTSGTAGGGGASSATSTTSTSGTGGAPAPPLDCNGPSPGPGKIVWQTILPPPAGVQWQITGLVVDAAGHSFVAIPNWNFNSANDVNGVVLEELDAAGTPIVDHGVSHPGDQADLVSLGIQGTGHFVAGVRLWNTMGQTDHLLCDTFDLVTQGDLGAHDVRIIRTVVDATGSVFALYDGADGASFSWGTETGPFLAKFDATGAHLWSRPFPSANGDDETALAADDTGGVFAHGPLDAPFDFGCGSLTNTGYVTRLDGSGACRWSAGVDTKDSGHPELLASGDEVYLSGELGHVDLGCGPLAPPPSPDFSYYLAKLGKTGGCLWSQSYTAFPFHVRRFPDGDLLLGLGFQGILDFGTALVSSAGGGDALLARLHPDGSLVWERHFGQARSMAEVQGVQVDVNGDLVAQIQFSGQVDFGGGPLDGGTGTEPLQYDVMLKLDGATGAYRWSASPFDGPFGLDSCGAVLVSSYCNECGQGQLWMPLVIKIAP